MSVISEVLTTVASLPRPLLILVVGALVLGECTVGLGFLVPGESGLLIASASVTNVGFFLGLSLCVAAAAAVGDTIGFWLGRRYGWRMRESRMIRKMGRTHWDRACRLLRRYGIGAVLVARFLPVVRTLTPAAAGASGLGYSRFLPASLLGATLWSILHVGIGWLAGASAKYVEDMLGRAGWVLAAALVLAGVTTWSWRRLRGRRRDAAQAAPTSPSKVADTDIDRAA